MVALLIFLSLIFLPELFASGRKVKNKDYSSLCAPVIPARPAGEGKHFLK